MTSTEIAELPSREEMDSAVKLITDNAQRVFLWDYDRSRGQLVTLYFFAKLVPNVRKLGLLDVNKGHLREKWGEAGLLEFEFAADTGSDYGFYGQVAKDRAAARWV